jgi:hypothetical protein
MGIAVEWWMKGAVGEALRDAVDYRIYTLENPDWTGLGEDAEKAGLSSSEVYEFLRNVREEG